MILSAMALAVSVLIVWPAPETIVQWRLGGDQRSAKPSSHRRVQFAGFLVVAALTAMVVKGGRFPAVVVAATVLGAVAAGWHFHRLKRRRSIRQQLRTDIAEAIDALISELESGIIATRALVSVAADWPIFAPAATASRLGGEVAESLREAARQPGAEALSRLASAWEVSDRAGSSQADILDKLGQTLRDERDLAREITAGLGPARATARLLAALPVLGLLLGSGLGGASVAVLLGTTIGSLCLGAGVLLACIGLEWVERIAAKAEQL